MVFNELVKEYDSWYEKPFGRSAYELELDCIRKLSRIPKRSLEVGVGTGRFASALGIRFGLDPAIEMLKLAKKRGVKVVAGVGEDMPFKGESFELVVSVVSICFVSEPQRVVGEVGRILVPGGRFLIGGVLADSPWADFYREKARRGHPIYKFARFHSYGELKEMLLREGFELRAVASTLMEAPQDKNPVRDKRVEKGFIKEAGFTCLLAEKI